MSKTRTLPLFALVLLSTVAVGCAPASSPRLNSEQEATISDTLLSTTAAYNAAWEDLDFDRI